MNGVDEDLTTRQIECARKRVVIRTQKVPQCFRRDPVGSTQEDHSAIVVLRHP